MPDSSATNGATDLARAWVRRAVAIGIGLVHLEYFNLNTKNLCRTHHLSCE